MRKLPVFRSVSEVFSGVTRHYFELIGVAALPLLAMLTVMVIGGALLWQSDLAHWYMEMLRQPAGSTAQTVPPVSGASGLLIVILVIAVMLLFAACAVRWHRFVLLGERPGASGAPLAIWRGEDGRYVITILKLSLVMIFAMIPVVAGSAIAGYLAKGGEGSGPGALGAVLFLGVFFLLMLLFVRISIALPDAALGGRGSVRATFDRTEGNSWRLLGYNVLVQLALMVVSLIYSLIAGLVLMSVFADSTNGAAMLTSALLNIPIYLYSSMIGVTMLSVAYREIVGLPGGEGAPAAAEPASAL
ncbi:hypothetical protein [Parvibaculum sp.]|uniref:hypothetical protein n=1 Tax=Parvibaculum sp. TaxID=2024848 RepID=UPI003BA8A0D7